MRESGKSASAMRCAHCGRAVRDTVHYRDGYSVDYHFLYTGEVQTDQTWDETEAVTRVVVHVRNPRFLFTCVDCYTRADVQEGRSRWFAPELESRE
mgnify:CR=1 FL=1